ncbi:anti-sigma factor [Fulvivirgaceae bacterium BMA10]|uniref:Anti-sigma factor n=1 Tax=Splendidivirga corallicola TaxID=3051826 RepID=A0ABT8KWM7_9BACT|nr:anti-sigma factor [Fulvivirgaceae bacterium BMA10]
MGKFSGVWLKSKLKFLRNMQCPDKANCFEILELMMDGEATEEQKKSFELQIQHCMPCYKKYHLDVAIKEVLQTKLNNKPAPVDLVDSIKLKINNNTI